MSAAQGRRVTASRRPSTTTRSSISASSTHASRQTQTMRGTSRRGRGQVVQMVPEYIDLTAQTPPDRTRLSHIPVVLGTSGGARPRSRVTRAQSVMTTPSLKKSQARKDVAVSPGDMGFGFQDSCPICLDKFEFYNHLAKNALMSTICGHLFCRSCITESLERKNFCPLCRHTLTFNEVHPIYQNV